MEKTKLVGTMGPASKDKVVLRQLMLAGLNVARMNLSHGDHAEHLERLSIIKELNEELGTNVGLMLDTRGPEMRTNEFEGGKVIIQKDDEVTLVFEEVLGTNEKFSINYPGLYDDVEVGTKILIDDGYLQTKVISKNKKDRSLVVKANNTHMIKNRRGVNIPNTLINMPFLSQKDREDILFGVKNNVDFIALSFVQKKEDVLKARELLNSNGGEAIEIISKIENQAGVDNIDEIIAASEGIMFARGDLGVEILPEDLPHIQKDVVEKCRQANKLVIIATQMVESMQNNPIPTRAEVSDVANAVFEGTDTVMLSGEMAAGKYPLESVEMMKRIVRANEKYVDYDYFTFPLESKDPVINNLSFMAKVSTEYSDVKAIIATKGNIATSISKYRPNAPIVAFASKEEATKLNAYFGIYPITSTKELDVKKTLMGLGINKGEKYLLVDEKSVTIKSL